MMINSAHMMNGRRVATASGAILADAALLDAARVDDARAAQELFDPRFWVSHGSITPVGGGRGAA